MEPIEVNHLCADVHFLLDTLKQDEETGKWYVWDEYAFNDCVNGVKQGLAKVEQMKWEAANADA